MQSTINTFQDKIKRELLDLNAGNQQPSHDESRSKRLKAALKILNRLSNRLQRNTLTRLQAYSAIIEVTKLLSESPWQRDPESQSSVPSPEPVTHE